MPFADWLDDLVKDFVNYVADPSFERLQFLWGGSPPGTLDTFIHLAVNTEERLHDVPSCLWVLKQGFLRVVTLLKFVAHDSAPA
jgi:hypothetical protein